MDYAGNAPGLWGFFTGWGLRILPKRGLEDRLVGGVYGVSIGAAFFAESMFTHSSNTAKVAFVHLVRLLEAWGFSFVDCQIHSDHVSRFGAVPWERACF